MRPLQASGLGIVVDKSKATKRLQMETGKCLPTRKQRRIMLEIMKHNKECEEQERRGELIIAKNFFHALWLTFWLGVPVAYRAKVTIEPF